MVMMDADRGERGSWMQTVAAADGEQGWTAVDR